VFQSFKRTPAFIVSSGVTRGLSQGGKAWLKGPTGQRRGPLANTPNKRKA